MRRRSLPACWFILLNSAACILADENPAETTPAQPGVVLQEFVYVSAPFPQCHASTIAESSGGLVAAWFGGEHEKHPSVGIWVARHDGKSWSPVMEAANGIQKDGTRHPCWNPVLFQPSAGPLLLFYKVGPSPSTWWGMLTTSLDGGKTWSEPARLPDPYVGPIKNKPIELSNGTLLCPSSTEDAGWRVHLESTSDLGKSFRSTGPLNTAEEFGAIQPSILRWGDRLQIVCRSRQQQIVQAWSNDSGRSWSPLSKLSLPNPNSGLDAVTLKDGRGLIVYNHTARGRSPLNVAVSSDGNAWQAAVVLERQPGEYSYPAVIQSGDGLVHVTYTWKRQRVKHVVLDPAKLELRDFVDGKWPE